MHGFNSQRLYCLSLGCCCLLIIIVVYFLLTGLKPCPMCVLQQLGLLCLTVISLIACCHKPKVIGVRIYSLLLGIIGLLSALVALKQIWMQWHQQEYIGSCQIKLDSIAHNVPMLNFLQTKFSGMPDCTNVDWAFLGISMAGYSFIFFIAFSVVHFWQFLFYTVDNDENKKVN